MLIDRFLEHWSLTDNPFVGEEARHDPIFQRLLTGDGCHPELAKVLGTPHQPNASVVFGEKGSGKTALKLLLEQRLARYNAENADRMAWVVRYDEFNGMLSRLARHGRRGRPMRAEQVIAQVRLADHLDAILSQAVTQLVDLLLGLSQRPTHGDRRKISRRMPRRQRIDLAHLAMCYDQPTSGNVLERWMKLRRRLRPGISWMARPVRYLAGLMAVVAAVMAVAVWLSRPQAGMWDWLAAIIPAAGAGLFGGVALVFAWRFARLARQQRRQVRVVERTTGQLRRMIEHIPLADYLGQPHPLPGANDPRYQLIRRLLNVLERLGYVSMIVLVDRVDEPTAVNGDPQRMQALIWPMLNNKFLQQERVGIKLMLPIELRYLLAKESAAFFQRARLDKQHMVDRLSWSGVTLYDLCNRRLAACRSPQAEPITLVGLFDEDVAVSELVDALEQMQQPRDAFKFLYQVIQEHCASVPEDQPIWRIRKLTLDAVRRVHSRRIDELHRGLGPA